MFMQFLFLFTGALTAAYKAGVLFSNMCFAVVEKPYEKIEFCLLSISRNYINIMLTSISNYLFFIQIKFPVCRQLVAHSTQFDNKPNNNILSTQLI